MWEYIRTHAKTTHTHTSEEILNGNPEVGHQAPKGFAGDSYREPDEVVRGVSVRGVPTALGVPFGLRACGWKVYIRARAS